MDSVAHGGSRMEHVDVLVIGAGISGIDAAYHLQTFCPDLRYAVLEARERLGGTWDKFRYPGVRSDSDMHTLGFGFAPWTAPQAIADGPAILAYLEETVDEHDIGRHIRYQHRVRHAAWSSAEARWTVTVERGDAGDVVTLTCGFLFVCAGYYSYQQGHTPDLPGRDRFRGTVVHPQDWPADLAVEGRRIVVVGSGATAMTIVPALAEAGAEHVTMLQRSPTYVVARPSHDAVAGALARVLPARLAYRLVRARNTWLQQLTYRWARARPRRAREWLVGMVRDALRPEIDVDTHFAPDYDPWEQRLCLVPDGDLFDALNAGTASVVTDTIATFTEDGIRTASGEVLPADVVVTATGLQLVTLGEVAVTVDGEPVDFSATWTYKGVMYADVPNLASTFGYVNASWTLRADLVCRFVTRVLRHMTATGTASVVPRLRPTDRDMPARPWIEDFTPGYMRRMLPALPRQGDREPWVNPQDHRRTKRLLVDAPVDDGVLRFTTPVSISSPSPSPGR